MAKKKKEEVVVEETTKKETPVKEEPKVDDKVEKIKVKKQPSMKKIIDDEVIKVDLSKPPKETKEEVKEEVIDKVEVTEEKETPVVEEITKEEVTEALEEVVEDTADTVKQAIDESEKTGEVLPENIQKVVNFMNETGGDLEDYVRLNQDYSGMDNQTILQEYYKKTKSHLTSDEIDFIMEDQFSYDEEADDEKDIKRKKLALKEQVASAKEHLDGLKSKYYEEIKSGSKLTQEQQEAINFYDGYKKESKNQTTKAKEDVNIFLNKTTKFFGDKFKGFEYSVGEKKFRFNVKDADKVKTTQSDINNFIGKFLDEKKQMKDTAGYHKSLFTAMNSDAIANHFYEQGKADAMKDSVAKAKNINMTPRQSHGEVEAGGVKVRVLGDDTADFKFKIKNRK